MEMILDTWDTSDIDGIDDIADREESIDMGSYNHSKIQANMTYVLRREDKYAVFTELSLDPAALDKNQFKLREEIKPDVCIYPKRGLSRPFDILKMIEMPLLVIEILSPKQGSQEILEKFAAYFALGVKSCWLIDPTTAIVAVYSSLEQREIFSTGDVVDKTIGLKVSFSEVFE